jgi:adenylate kinase family enzyme
MKELMRRHFSRYPMMQIADMIKLLYQSEFAGGHMIHDAAESLRRLEAECHGIKPAADLTFEDIGGGLCRLYLSALPALGVSPATVNRLFIATAATVKGLPDHFVDKLDEFVSLCRSGVLPFSADAAVAYVGAYLAQGCPPVSHSEVYRTAYTPAYRVVKAAYCRYIALFRRIDALLDGKASVSVAIDGNSGAGKSTLASLIAEVYNCNVFHADDFFLPPERKTTDRLAEPGGNVDYERLKREVIAGLKSGSPFQYRRYDCRSGVLSVPVDVTPKRLNVVEGVYSLHPALDMPYDIKVFLKTDGTAQKQRILQRSGAALLKRFEDEWIPLENRYFSDLDIIHECNLVFNID